MYNKMAAVTRSHVTSDVAGPTSVFTADTSDVTYDVAATFDPEAVGGHFVPVPVRMTFELCVTLPEADLKWLP